MLPFALAVVLAAGCDLPDTSDGDGDGSARTPEGSASVSDRPDPGRTADKRTNRSQRADRLQRARLNATSTLTWGPTRAEWAAARRIVAEMGPEEKAGQVIVAGYDGTDAPLALLRRYHVGGVIVMGPNIQSVRQVRSVNLTLQAEAGKQGRSWPLVVGVDQEGGSVARIRDGITQFPPYMSLGAAGDPALAERLARASGKELRALGFTMVFAPVADVTEGPADPTIGRRSAGDDPTLVSAIVKGSLRGYSGAGIVAVPKHFPGHGSVPADSHTSLPVQHATLSALSARDFVPFRDAAAAGAEAMMVAHIDVRDVDPGTPSSVSAKVVRGLLRERLGFQGVVVTDALQMAGVAEKYGSADAGVRSLLAGADLLLLPSDAGALHAAILRALESGRLPQDRLDEAASRSVALMLHHKASAGPDPSSAVLGTSSALAYQASLRGLTVVSGPCGGRLVGPKVRVAGGTESDRDRFATAARDVGLQVAETGDLVHLLGRGTSGGTGDVVVALRTPYGLATSHGRTARLALYGRTPEAFRALADVLTGRARGTGRLPVKIDGIRPGAGCASDAHARPEPR